jgi:hypothetical protein
VHSDFPNALYKVDDRRTAAPYLTDNLCDAPVMWEVYIPATARSVSKSGAEFCDVVGAEVVSMKCELSVKSAW